ncbi:MAG: hypothetical protein ABSC29_00395 [Minisyncoccia bacterium]|jgi:hypothetical protein
MKKIMVSLLFLLPAVVFLQGARAAKTMPSSTSGVVSDQKAAATGSVIVVSPRITSFLENLAKTNPSQSVQVIIEVSNAQRQDVLQLAESLGGKLTTDNPLYNNPRLPLFITIPAGKLLDLVASKYDFAISENGIGSVAQATSAENQYQTTPEKGWSGTAGIASAVGAIVLIYLIYRVANKKR